MLTALVVILVVLAVLLGYAATRPDTFRIERAVHIEAPVEKVFPLISDFRQWPAWSPWEKMDPGMKKTHSGAASGKGAVYEWEGNKKVGKGRMEILEAAPLAKVTLKLDFYAPFEAHNITEFTLEARGASTGVNWAMHGPQPFMFKLMGVFMSMDKMVGKDFEAGLASMKAAAEK